MTSDELRRVLTIIGECIPHTSEGKLIFEDITAELCSHKEFNLREVLSIDQTRQRMGVSRRTIYNWMQRSKIEHVRTSSGRVRIFADSLWQEER